MASASSQEKSPEEIEEEITSIQTVTWNPFTILPKEIYLEIFDKLDNADDKQNFMNAHEKFYDLFKTKRTCFLFKGVLKELKGAKEPCLTRKDLFNYRLVCHDWDEVIQDHFQLNPSNFNLDTLEKGDTRGSFLQALLLDMVMGRRTAGGEALSRNPYFSWIGSTTLENALEIFSETHPPPKNPFLSRKLGIFPSLVGDYGGGIFRYRKAMDTLLELYGQHIFHCTMVAADLLPQTCLQIAKWLRLMPELKTFYIYFTNLSSPPLSRASLNEIRELVFPQPELKNLLVLKTAGIYSEVYNKLFGNVKEVEKIEIKLKNQQKSFFKDFQGPNRETLKEAFFTLKNLQDFKYFNGEPFQNVKKLLIALKSKLGGKAQQPGWPLVFKALEEKFPALEDLSIRLPTDLTLTQAKKAKIQSFDATLNLPNLKTLWISLPHFASIDFLYPCKALEELKIVLEHRTAVSREWGNAGREEKIKFLMDLGTLKQSNIWKEFPKIKLLVVDDGRDHIYRYHCQRRKTSAGSSQV